MCVYRDNKCTVWCQCGNCTYNYLRGTEDAEDLHKVCPKCAQRRSERKKDVAMKAERWSSWSIQIPQFFVLWWPAMKAGSIAMTQRPRDRVPSGSMLASSLRPKKARQSKSTLKLLVFPFFDSTGMIYMHWVPTGQTVNKENYVEVLREFRKRFLGKRPALLKLGQWHFHQDNAPVHNSILVTDSLTKMGIKTVLHCLYSPDLAPHDFCLFPKPKEKLRGCCYETIERWKRLWWRSLTHSHKRTYMGLSRSCLNGTTSALQPEEITLKGNRVSCVYYQ